MPAEEQSNPYLEAARDEFRRGIAIIDLPYGSKVPGRSGWQHERYDEEALLARLSGEPRNLSILFGEPSGGLVDVDLDCAEARALATELLPETGEIFGREGSPGSHFLYVTDPVARYSKFSDPEAPDENRATLVEIRSGGHHTIIPPSKHPSGQTVRWERRGEPARIPGDDLAKRVGALAAAALLARHWNKKGQRQDQALALCGGLIGGGWEAEEAASFVESVARVAYDEEWRYRGKAADSTADKQAEEEPTTGWPRLAELMGEEIVVRAREWLGLAEGRGAGQKEQQASQADLLVELAAAAYLFHDPNSEVYATIPVRGHKETYRLDQKAFKNWLRYRFYEHTSKAPGGQAVTDAVGTLAGKAAFDAPERETHVRVAGHEGNLYLDLANEAWEVVEITTEGWRVMPGRSAPVRFRRPGGMLPLPHPVGGGDLSGLRRLLNLPEDDHERGWRLIAAWLVAALHPSGPYPALILQGEQGSAKSSAQELLRACLDPNSVSLRTYPRNELDLVIAANNGRVVSFDNLSGLPGWLSDALCRIATGGGLSTRTLYTNEGETLFSAKRPLVMNGIASVATRPDLLDRSLVVELPVIPEERRRTEREVKAEFEAEHPRILGALLDAAAGALRRLPSVRPEKRPRMAEFAEWITAAEGTLGWEPGTFMAAYDEARAEAEGAAIEGDPVADAVLALMADKREWTGTPKELYETLSLRAGEKVQRTKAWPKAAQSLTPRLKRLAPVLRKLGLEFEEYEEGDKSKTRKKRLYWREGEGPSEKEIEQRYRQLVDSDVLDKPNGEDGGGRS